MLQQSRAILTSALSRRTMLVIACLMVPLNGCNRDVESRRKGPPAAAQNVAAVEQNRLLPPCPKAPYAMLQANHPNVGHHKVFLRWNASSSASEVGPNGLGYCLYRTQAPGTAKNCPAKHPKCEQINVEPVRGTRCVDDLVKDTTTYYYVALAITFANGKSTASEEAIAQVPSAGEQKTAPPDGASYPAFRTSTTATQPAQP